MKEKIKNIVPKIKLSPIEQESFPKEFEYFRENVSQKSSWRAAEVKALRKGVEKYGKSWKRILQKYEDVFDETRKVADLAAKYNLICKNSSYYKTSSKDWVQVDEEGNCCENWAGYIPTITHKFPYDAAKKFAKKKIANGYKKFNITVREASDISNIHTYSVEAQDYGKIIIKKLIEKR